MLKGSKVHAACNVTRLYEISYVKGVKKNKNTHNTEDLRHLSLMSKESKVHSIDIVLQLYFHLIYNVVSNTKSSNYIKI